MRSVALVALIAPARGRASKKIINIMHTGAARCFWKPKWPWVKTKPLKPAKPPKPSTTGRAVCNARFLLREVHVSGALFGACTGKGPQIANPRPTPKPGNLGPPWPPGTGGNMSSACSVLPRDLVSVEVAAQQVGAHPQTLLTRSTFPVRYPVRAPERGPRWQTHAQRRNLGISVRVDQVHVSGALSGACTGKEPQMANPRLTPKPGNLGPPWPPGTSGDPAGYSRGAAPSGAQDYRWFVRDPLGLTPPGYELAPHTGLDKAPPRTRNEGRLDARATSHWSRIATQPRSCLPGAVTSA